LDLPSLLRFLIQLFNLFTAIAAAAHSLNIQNEKMSTLRTKFTYTLLHNGEKKVCIFFSFSLTFKDTSTFNFKKTKKTNEIDAIYLTSTFQNGNILFN